MACRTSAYLGYFVYITSAKYEYLSREKVVDARAWSKARREVGRDEQDDQRSESRNQISGTEAIRSSQLIAQRNAEDNREIPA